MSTFKSNVDLRAQVARILKKYGLFPFNPTGNHLWNFAGFDSERDTRAVLSNIEYCAWEHDGEAVRVVGRDAHNHDWTLILSIKEKEPIEIITIHRGKIFPPFLR